MPLHSPMSRVKKYSTLSGLINDSDSEPDAQMPTPDSANERNMAAKGKTGRAKAIASAHHPSSGKTAGNLKAVPKAAPRKKGRPALVDRSNAQDAGNETEEVDEFDQLENDLLENTIMTTGNDDELSEPAVIEKKKPGRKAAVKPIVGVGEVKKTKAIKRAPKKDIAVAEETSEVPRISNAILPAKKASRGRKAEPKVDLDEQIIQETQPEVMDVDELEDTNMEDVSALDEPAQVEETMQVEDSPPKPTKKTGRPPQVQSLTRQPSNTRIRPHATLEPERVDPALRRKLGDLTQKLESSEIRYRNLRDVGTTQAEEKFDLLKKHSDSAAKIAKTLITSLKSTVSTQELQLKDLRSLKKQHATQAIEISSLQSEILKLNATLAEAQRANKTLSTTLAAKRVAASTVESATISRVPGSAMKTGVVRMIGSQEAAESAEKASLKEDLYGDLTGLLIRSVKRGEEEDIYDCIQTGRNGTLHFKLAISNEKSADSYDDAQCSYEPQLDPSRDKDLINMLSMEADYLCEQICFPRPQAAKFYGRMARALTEKRD